MPPKLSAVDPVGAVDVFDRLSATGMKITRAAVNRWQAQRATTGYPEPKWTVSGNPVWEWVDILAWLQRTGRAAPPQ